MRQQYSPKDRREFIGAAATALLAGVAVQFLGCKNESSVTSPAYAPENPGIGTPIVNPILQQNAAASANPAAATTDKTASITNPSDPKHSAIVTGAQQDSDLALTLHIQGTETHDHTVDLTAQDILSLKNGVAVVKTSSTTLDHFHTVTWATATAIMPSIYSVGG